uniref:Uncharacterized protein n=1 Tax=Meleagris gallopavo TaxID=9103 RepID=A0A803XRZ4_MELGA
IESYQQAATKKCNSLLLASVTRGPLTPERSRTGCELQPLSRDGGTEPPPLPHLLQRKGNKSCHTPSLSFWCGLPAPFSCCRSYEQESCQEPLTLTAHTSPPVHH